LNQLAPGSQSLPRQAQGAGLHIDYSIDSIALFLRWVIPQLQKTSLVENRNNPLWIRQTESDQGGRLQFSDQTSYMIFYSAYFLVNRLSARIRSWVGSWSQRDCLEEYAGGIGLCAPPTEPCRNE
jgi:hypothetical protein